MIEGRAFTTGKECLPCAITTGDMLKMVEKPGFDQSKAAFFMPVPAGLAGSGCITASTGLSCGRRAFPMQR